ncbi:TPR-like protein [Cylindrobasidium torrendii FP15055 ss-10]|uniref:TPR-like protein n=1 Tax=Cylindrobasidium torrendii FP15055 ss-10 TaxID=1314674 RepID=A0A0D7B5A3_9AGAR|nr:TPR-like protein [Cylindrobasidium torrendii FP15055 ss-10]
MRLWRHDAMMQHLYVTAAFWGDKILSWTDDPNDAFWLAQTYSLMHQYSRAERLLTRPFPKTTSPNAPSSSQPSVSVLSLPLGPGEIAGSGSEEHGSSDNSLVDVSVACRYLAAQCMVKQGHWSAAMDLLGESNPFRDSGRSGPSVRNADGGIKIEASMCHLRGVVMQQLGRIENAKECYMEALLLDVKCYESYDKLVSAEMMTTDEEWEFFESLPYSSQVHHKESEFVKLMYTTRLRKYKHAEEHTIARQKLVQQYGMKDNPDVLFSFADTLYISFRWKDCFTITSRILTLIPIHDHTMPLHIACMYHISHLHSKLFILAHDMVDREPENALSWYAVGVWYLGNKKWTTARQYFSKASLIDPRLAATWVAFAHTYALEGEHDHAITAYSTAARMFTGSHLPLMFIGMEQLTLSNLPLAEEALVAAHSVCNTDPLLLNEMGVLHFNKGDWRAAHTYFQDALRLAEITQSSRSNWAPTYLNFGTTCRKLGKYNEALQAYQTVLDLEPGNATALAFKGMVHHLQREFDPAILAYHEALSIDPLNSRVLELLNIALEQTLYPSFETLGKEVRAVTEALANKFKQHGYAIPPEGQPVQPIHAHPPYGAGGGEAMHIG